jgi:two-component system chemotaxis response regulator CheY
MNIVTSQTENYLAEMLPIVERQPDAWMCIRVNIAPIHDQILEKEGISRLALENIRKMSLQLADQLNVLGLSQYEGSIMVFEDSDVLALFVKKLEGLPALLEDLRREFTKNGMLHILIIEEMKEKLAHLVSVAEEKKESAENYIIKQRAMEIGEMLLEWTQPDPAITRAIYKKRRKRQGSCVLIIEDDVVTRGLVASLLKREHQVLQAKDAESGIVSYIDHAPNVVFLDIHLPGMDGRDTLKRLMQLDPEAYVVMLSADSAAENVVSTHIQGAAGFIRKPFSKEKILEYIKKCPSLNVDATARVLGWTSMKDGSKE